MDDVPGLIETQERLAAGQLTPRQAVERCWTRAQALEPELQAFAHLPAAPPAAGTGPLAGIAVGVKDLIDTADMPTAYGAAVYRGHRSLADAEIVARLRALGASVLGKTVTTEFAYRQPGPTRNPHDLRHTPGGSSSGSAAAVAAGIVPLALGTQTMGSVIRPAAFCGIVGVKPTFGTLPRAGVHPLCDALDHVGLLARSVADAAAALTCLAHLQPPADVRERPFRLAALPLSDPTIEPAQRRAAEAAWQVIRAAGHSVDRLDLPPVFEDVDELIDTLLSHDAAIHFGALVEQHGDAVGAPMRDLVARGRAVGADQNRDALARQAELREIYAGAIEDYDAVLTIPAAGEAPLGLQSTGDPRFCAPWSLVGAPALTIPVGLGPSGLPLGLQIVGHCGQDAMLLRIGAAVQGLFPAGQIARAGG